MTRRRLIPCIAVLGSWGLAACTPAMAQVTAKVSSPSPARTAAETIPADTALVDLLYHPAAAHGALVHTPVLDVRLRLLILTVNALPVARQPVTSCSPTSYETAQITVDGPQTLQLRGSLGRCGVLHVTVGGVAQPALVVTNALRTAVRQAAAPWPPAPPVAPLEAALRPVAHSTGAAEREADTALLLARLPEAIQVSTPATVAPDDLFIGDGPPSVIERETRWTSAETPYDLIDWVLAHPPEGLRATSSESGDGSVSESFTSDHNPYVSLRFTADAAANGSAVRVNGQVFWTPSKPSAETVAATSATLHYVAPMTASGKPGTRTNIRLKGAALTRVLHAVNALQTQTLNIVSGCGGDNGESAVLRVRNHGHLVAFSIALTGCNLVDVTAAGLSLPVLRDSDALNAAVRAAAHTS